MKELVCQNCGAAEHPAAPFKDADGYCDRCASLRPPPGGVAGFLLQPVSFRLPRLASLFWLCLSLWSLAALYVTLHTPTTVNVVGIGHVHNLDLAQRQTTQVVVWGGVWLFSSAMLVFRSYFRHPR